MLNESKYERQCLDTYAASSPLVIMAVDYN